MNILDGIIIIVILLAAFRGYHRGMVKTLTGFVGNILAFYFAWTWSPLTANWLQSKFQLQSFLGEWLLKVVPLPETVAAINPQQVPNSQWEELLAQVKLPLLLKEGLVERLQIAGKEAAQTIGEAVAQALGGMLMQLLAFVILAIGLIIILRLIGGLITSGIRNTVFGGLNRLSGLLLGGLTIVVVLGILANSLLPFLELLPGGPPDVVASSVLLPRIADIFGKLVHF